MFDFRISNLGGLLMGGRELQFRRVHLLYCVLLFLVVVVAVDMFLWFLNSNNRDFSDV